MAQDNASITDLISAALAQASRLFRSEVQLARAEVSANLSQAALPIGILLVGTCVLIASLVLVLSAFSAWLVQQGWAKAAADLIAGGLGIFTSGTLAWYAASRLRQTAILPEETVEQVRKDVTAVKEQF